MHAETACSLCFSEIITNYEYLTGNMKKNKLITSLFALLVVAFPALAVFTGMDWMRRFPTCAGSCTTTTFRLPRLGN